MKTFTCIECPRGCTLSIDDDLNVTGNSCPRGAKYAVSEVTNPTRMITSTVKLDSKLISRLPVITSAPVPKGKMFDVMAELAKVEVKAPVRCHDVIISNVLGLGVDIVASRSVEF